jgi:hypothetical protein
MEWVNFSVEQNLEQTLVCSEILLGLLTYPQIQTKIFLVHLEKFYSKNFEMLMNTNEPLTEQIFGQMFLNFDLCEQTSTRNVRVNQTKTEMQIGFIEKRYKNWLFRLVGI